MFSLGSERTPSLTGCVASNPVRASVIDDDYGGGGSGCSVLDREKAKSSKKYGRL